MTDRHHYEEATFGAGCFWCVEAAFEQLDGVINTLPGYAGGHVENPTYEQVCTKTTGHAEVCRIVFDPAVISFDDLLAVFWTIHDPTTPDRQGNDIGPQYRSVIFYHSPAQKAAAEAMKRRLEQERVFDAPIVTAIEPLRNFYPAEEYHRHYFQRNPSQSYCQ
ncbi:MAG: peptide-methionine (S)-S-oxide reductase, partial [Planctomycetota bacterium]